MPRNALRWVVVASAIAIVALLVGGMPLVPSAGENPITGLRGSSIGANLSPAAGPSLDEIRSSPPVAVPSPVDWPTDAAFRGGYSGTVDTLVEFRAGAGLSDLLSDLETPSSPQYRHYLTASEFANEFGVPSTSYAAIVAYLSSAEGVHVTTFPDRLSVEFSGPANAIGKILGVGFGIYSDPSRGGFYAPRATPQLPSALAQLVTGVYGLDDYLMAHFDLGIGPTSFPAPDGPVSGYPQPLIANGAQFLWGSDLQIAYDETPLLAITNASHESVATVLAAGETGYGTPVGPYVPSDIANYYNETLPPGEPHATVTGVPVDGAMPPGLSAADDATADHEENTLDLEMVGSTAPGASIYNVYGPNETEASLLDAFVEAVNLNVSVITNSWSGGDFNGTGWTQYFQETAARGITVLASSGDSGDNPASSKWTAGNPNPYGVGFPANVATATYGVVAVGGTTVSLTQDLTRDEEVAWNISDGDLAGGGPAGSVGGVSMAFPEPYWQSSSAASVIIASNGTSGRGVPDLAAMANNTLMCVTSNGLLDPALAVWGTSVASPVVAGLIAEADAVFAREHGASSRLGFIEPTLYALGTEESRGILADPPLFDVTEGANARFPALPGYDLVTGWGVPNAYNLTMWLMNTTTYNVTFVESGLPVGTTWSVTLASREVASASSSIQFLVLNGSFDFSVNTVLGFAPTPPSGSVIIEGSSALREVKFHVTGVGGFPVIFPESGLVAGTDWSVLLNGTVTSSTNASITVIVPNGTYAFDVLPIAGYGSEPTNGSADVAGGPVSQPITFVPEAPPVILYPIWLNETGLPSGTTWSLTINGREEQSSTATIMLTGPNGSYPFSVASPLDGYVASPTFGSVIVAGGPVVETFAFTAHAYNLTFVESGLPPYTSWGVVLDEGSSTHLSVISTLEFSVANGTHAYEVATAYDFWYAAASPYGLVTVAGNSTTVAVVFSAVFGQSQVTFSELGLPYYTVWSVTVGGDLTTLSNSNTLGLLMTNGNWSYTVGALGGYSVTPSSGWVNVSSSPVSVLLSFHRVVPVFTVEFEESGLPTSATWAVQLHGKVGASSSTSIEFSVQEGQYSYDLGTTLPGWTATPSSGTVAVQENATVDVLFAPTVSTSSVYFTQSGLEPGTSWGVNFSGTVYRSTAATIVIPNVAPGEYSYAALAPGAGFEALPSQGTVAVNSTSVSLGITYSPVEYSVTFSEAGLPPGTTWAVLFAGVVYASDGVSVRFSVVPGTYRYLVSDLTGYTASPVNGSVSVFDTNVTVAIAFAPGAHDPGGVLLSGGPGASHPSSVRAVLKR